MSDCVLGTISLSIMLFLSLILSSRNLNIKTILFFYHHLSNILYIYLSNKLII